MSGHMLSERFIEKSGSCDVPEIDCAEVSFRHYVCLTHFNIMTRILCLILMVFNSFLSLAQSSSHKWNFYAGFYVGKANVSKGIHTAHYLVSPNPFVGIDYCKTNARSIRSTVGVGFSKYASFRRESQNVTSYARIYLKSYLTDFHFHWEFPSKRKKYYYLVGTSLHVPLANHAKGVFYSGPYYEFRSLWMARDFLPAMLRLDFGITWNHTLLEGQVRTRAIKFSVMRFPKLKDYLTDKNGNVVMCSYSCDIPFSNFRSLFHRKD
jgi:hypothetical protein